MDGGKIDAKAMAAKIVQAAVIVEMIREVKKVEIPESAFRKGFDCALDTIIEVISNNYSLPKKGE